MGGAVPHRSPPRAWTDRGTLGRHGRPPGFRGKGSVRRRAGCLPADQGKGRLLIAALVLLHLLVMAAGAWWSWREAWRAAAADLERSAAAGAEFGLRVLSSHAVAAGRVDAAMRGLSDDEVRAQESKLHIELNALIVEVPQAEASYVVDREGYPLVSANLYPVPRDRPIAADRDFFVALRGPGAPALHVSRVQEGRFDSTPFFAVSRRRTRTGNPGLPPGAFGGLVNLSVYPDRLGAGLSRVAGHSRDAVSLLQEDGEVLVRGGGPDSAPDFPLDGRALAPERPGAGRAADHRAGGAAREPVLVAVRRIEGWPVYAAAGRTRGAILAGRGGGAAIGRASRLPRPPPAPQPAAARPGQRGAGGTGRAADR